MKDEKYRSTIGLITLPMDNASILHSNNLARILTPLSTSVNIITSTISEKNLTEKPLDVRMMSVLSYSPPNNIVGKLLFYVKYQIRASNMILKNHKDVDIWIFFLESHILFIPVLCLKLINKKIVFLLGASIRDTATAKNDILKNVLLPIEKINCYLSNCIVAYSNSLIYEWGIEKYKKKIKIAHEHFIEIDKFKLLTKYEDRRDLIGYIGRLSKEKGVLNFVESMPLILEEQNIRFLIGGDGPLNCEVQDHLRIMDMQDKVEFTGWIKHEDLAIYLNKFKLLVLPSYTEGLPHIILEAMACDTPVLATPVGAIPDIIKDGETGFLMENNSPECIAANVIRALEHPDLESVANRARALVEREFTFDKAVERWREILDEVRDGGEIAEWA